MWIVLAVLGCFALFLLVPEEEAPVIDDTWAREQWLSKRKPEGGRIP